NRRNFLPTAAQSSRPIGLCSRPVGTPCWHWNRSTRSSLPRPAHRITSSIQMRDLRTLPYPSRDCQISYLNFKGFEVGIYRHKDLIFNHFGLSCWLESAPQPENQRKFASSPVGTAAL